MSARPRPRVPLNRLRIWSDYTMQGGLFEGVQVGGGIRYIGETFGDDANTFKVPAIHRGRCATRL